MSRLARHPIEIPKDTEVTVKDDLVTVSGPKGELSRSFKPGFVDISITDDGVVLEPVGNSRQTKALWGTYASHVNNMIVGVTEGYEKKLAFKGVGYQGSVQGDTLTMELGFSHPITFHIPDGLDVKVEKSEVSISGIDKEEVGQFAARVRAARKPEPYKGTGVRYADEIIRRKEGKKTV